MKILLNKILLPVAIFFSLIACSKDNVTENVSVSSHVLESYNYVSNETELINLINNYRVAQGLNTLILDNYVSKVSENHNFYMIDKNVISHDLFLERFKEIVANLGAKKVSENVAFNFNTPQSVLNAWINSPEHKSNLDGDYTHFGISIKNNANGVQFYTNIFFKK